MTSRVTGLSLRNRRGSPRCCFFVSKRAGLDSLASIRHTFLVPPFCEHTHVGKVPEVQPKLVIWNGSTWESSWRVTLVDPLLPWPNYGLAGENRWVIIIIRFGAWIGSNRVNRKQCNVCYLLSQPVSPCQEHNSCVFNKRSIFNAI